MSTIATPDEQPKSRVARRVVTPKRRYFMPDHGLSVNAEDAVEASKAVRLASKREEGDGK